MAVEHKFTRWAQPALCIDEKQYSEQQQQGCTNLFNGSVKEHSEASVCVCGGGGVAYEFMHYSSMQ